MDETQTLLYARQAIRLDDKATATRLLYQVIRQNPGNVTAWLWLSALVDDPVKERDCLERVIKIDPDNEIAQRHLARLDQEQAPTPQPAPQPTAEEFTQCPHCGESVEASLTFCSHCGYNLKTGEPFQVIEPSPPAPEQHPPTEVDQQKSRTGRRKRALWLIIAILGVCALVLCALYAVGSFSP